MYILLKKKQFLFEKLQFLSFCKLGRKDFWKDFYKIYETPPP